MADIMQCLNPQAHEHHDWTEDVGSHTHYHHCHGVTAFEAAEHQAKTYPAGSRTRRTLILTSKEYTTVMAALANLVATFPDDDVEAVAHKKRAHAIAARLNAARAWRGKGSGPRDWDPEA